MMERGVLQTEKGAELGELSVPVAAESKTEYPRAIVWGGAAFVYYERDDAGRLVYVRCSTYATNQQLE